MSIRGEERCECLWRTTVLRTGILEHLKKKIVPLICPSFIQKISHNRKLRCMGTTMQGSVTLEEEGGVCAHQLILQKMNRYLWTKVNSTGILAWRQDHVARLEEQEGRLAFLEQKACVKECQATTGKGGSWIWSPWKALKAIRCDWKQGIREDFSS